MNNCRIEWSIHGYQNELAWQQLVSINDGVGQRGFTMIEVHFSLDQGSFVISESSTCSKEAYDYMTPQYTKITKETQ